MRIISGKLKGRRFVAPDNLPVRPTTDYAKESLFNIINNKYYFEDLQILDCFSGTGNISYEFLSRGVGHVTAFDADANCIAYQNKIKADLGLENFSPARQDVFKALSSIQKRFDIIFCDPPYDMDNISEIPEIVFKHKLITEDGWLIVEHSKKTNFRHSNYIETRRYGNVSFSIFSY